MNTDGFVQLVRDFVYLVDHADWSWPQLEDAVAASIADDLGDVYRDLAGPLAAFDSDRHTDALLQWKFDVQGHCGDHIVNALRAIHRAVNDNMPFDYNPAENRS